MDLRACLNCGSRRIRRVRETVRLGRRKVAIPGVPLERCEACGAKFFDGESDRVIRSFTGKRSARAGA